MIDPITPRQRGSRELWLAAAYELLISGGVQAVKVMPMAKRLNLTRTGFYWYFEDLSELHREMIQTWEDQNTGQLVARCKADASTICQALLNLMDCWFDNSLFDAPLDLAIRNWARIDHELEQRLETADALRISAVTDMFRRFGYFKQQAEVRGLTVINTQIGHISMRIAENRHERLARVPHYIELFSGIAPAQQDVYKFMQRHGFLLLK